MSRIVRIDTLHSGDRHSCAANGDGIRVVVWWLGCDKKCPGCHNQEYWDFDNDDYDEFNDNHIRLVLDEVEKYDKIYSGLSILGGEPFSPRNIDDVIKMCVNFKEMFPDKNIWIWSGHTYEWLLKQEGQYGEDIKELLNWCDVLVDGPFILDKRNISLKFRGSENQRIINLKYGKYKEFFDRVDHKEYILK